MTTADKYHVIRQRRVDAARRANRDPTSVTLVAVSKGGSMDQIVDLIACGHLDFGESRVQQLQDRIAALPASLKTRGMDPGLAVAVRWHMIGHLQRNKAATAAGYSWLIHGVDSMRLAEELESVGQRRGKLIRALLEVNVSGEESKYGVKLPAARHMYEQFRNMSALRFVGLMTMAPNHSDPEKARESFIILRELFDEIRLESDPTDDFDQLSMGMSNDFEAAVEEGATLIRVGTAIFGPSQTQALESL